MSASRQAIFWLAALALFFVLLDLLSGILLPFVAGFGIAYLLAPFVELLTRWKTPRGAAALAALTLFILGLAAIVVLIVPLLEIQVAQLARSAPAIVAYGRQQFQALLDLAQRELPPEDIAKIHDVVGTWLGSALSWGTGLAERLVTSGVAIADVLTLLLITPLVAFFLLRDWDAIVARIDSWLPRAFAPTIREQFALVDETLSGYLHGQTLVSLILATYYAIALSLAGLDFAFIIGVVIGVLSFIPYIGLIVGAILALGLAAIQFGSWGKIVVIAAIFAFGHFVESNFLTPKLIGDRVHLHQLWVIFALLAFGTLFGFLGVLLALPAAAVMGVLVRFALSRYLASPFYDPSLARNDEPE